VKVIIKKRAQNNLRKVAKWIAEQNFPDTGVKWLDEFNETIGAIAKSGVKLAICKHPSLARYQYRCITYKQKWVIAYKITPATITIYKFMLGSKLK
jgi:hypothetical protein